MDKQMQKAVNAMIRLSIVLFLGATLLFSCKESKSTNEDNDLLDVFLLKIKSKSKDNILYLEKNNSNELVLDRFDKYLKYNDIVSDSIVDIVFSRSEYENYKKQTKVNSNWNIELQNIKDINIEWNNDKTEQFMHISKPIFSIKRNYALVYFLSKGKKGIYFMPKIQVYHKKIDSWEKVFDIPIKQF